MLGDRFAHPGWGEGTVGQIAGDQITVVFDNVGYTTLSLELVLERSC